MNANNHIDQLNVLCSFNFPVTEEQVDLFLNSNVDYKLKADPSRVNAKRILEEVRDEDFKPSGSDYFKRTVLAAEIIYRLHNEWSLGHVKLQKLIYLCQNTTGMALHTNFLKQAMGPYDPKLMRSIDTQLKNKKWFAFNRNSPQKYWPLENAGEHREWFEKYFSQQKSEIDRLINIFKKANSDQVELVATLYASWVKMNDENQKFDKIELQERFYTWSKEKQKFKPENVASAIDWMLDKGIYPL